MLEVTSTSVQEQHIFFALVLLYLEYGQGTFYDVDNIHFPVTYLCPPVLSPIWICPLACDIIFFRV